MKPYKLFMGCYFRYAASSRELKTSKRHVKVETSSKYFQFIGWEIFSKKKKLTYLKVKERIRRRSRSKLPLLWSNRN